MSRPGAPSIPLAAWHLAVLMFAVTFLGAPAARVVAAAAGLADRDIPSLSQVITFSIGGAVIFAVPWMRSRAMHLLATPVPRSCYAEVALAVIVAAMGEFALFGLRASVRWIDGGDAAVCAMSLGPAHARDAAFAASTLRDLAIGCLMAPLLEEIFYRGTLFEALARRHRLLVAILASSAVFALVHPTPLHAFFGGLVLCALYVRTGALRASILVHFSANALNWYPLLGQYVIPQDNRGIGSWHLQLTCLAIAPALVAAYVWVAARSGRCATGVCPESAAA